MTATYSPTPELRAPPVPQARPRAGQPRLRARLVGIDTIALVTAWTFVLVVVTSTRTLDAMHVGAVVITIGASLLAIRGHGLYRARVCAVRSVEIARLFTAMLIAAATVAVVGNLAHQPWRGTEIVIGVAGSFVLLVLARGRYARWLRLARSSEHFCRPVIIVGTGAESAELTKLLALHPEVGMRTVGIVGPQPDSESPTRWLGGIDDTIECLRGSAADTVIIAASDLTPRDLNHVTRTLTRAGVHVHISSGLHGISARRVRALPLARDPFFYLEPVSLSRVQHVVKRTIDIVGATLILLAAAPVIAIAAIAVRAEDGGPVFFRQVRVGLRGRPFRLFKLRTMVPDAETQLVDLTLRNEREGGPLFKLAQDPRRTRVGRILEKTSFDELPQLINVLRGEMSLVGPRPALPHEVAQFSEELQARHDVAPGITGLWQVEGRESPAFALYERLDLFYVENWSVGLDIVIICGTLRAVLSRLVPERP